MTLEDLMDKGKTLMINKSQDYTRDPLFNRYENFERSALVSSWFDYPIDRSFVCLITTKLARLATLLNGKSPKNESIEDTFVDLINYCALWGGRRIKLDRNELMNLLKEDMKQATVKLDGSLDKQT